MSKNLTTFQDFEYLTTLIRKRIPLTPEQKELWKQCLVKVEEEIDKPVSGEPVVKYKVDKHNDTFDDKKPSLIRRFKNWLISLLEEKEA